MLPIPFHTTPGHTMVSRSLLKVVLSGLIQMCATWFSPGAEVSMMCMTYTRLQLLLRQHFVTDTLRGDGIVLAFLILYQHFVSSPTAQCVCLLVFPILKGVFVCLFVFRPLFIV